MSDDINVVADDDIPSPLDPPKGDCVSCRKRPATTWWVGEGGTLAFVHGMGLAYCERCAVEAQLDYARTAAKRIPDLERRLRELP